MNLFGMKIKRDSAFAATNDTYKKGATECLFGSTLTPSSGGDTWQYDVTSNKTGEPRIH